jgi:hypothetical protein
MPASRGAVGVNVTVEVALEQEVMVPATLPIGDGAVNVKVPVVPVVVAVTEVQFNNASA